MKRAVVKFMERACLAVFALFNSALTAIPAYGLYTGEIQQLAKGGQPKVLHLSTDPIGFVATLCIWLFAAFAFWTFWRMAWHNVRDI
jgi:RsiW-degrading membrane proteinase PrsW (M82 family)